MVIKNIKRASSQGVLLLAVFLSACATPDHIVLLPQPDGSSSAIVVRSKAGDLTLDKPYATADVTSASIVQGQTDATEVNKRYQQLSAALPPRPRVYLLYFESGGDQLTPDSAAKLGDILNDMKQVPAAELLVVGHTDRVGSDQVNDEVSNLRANTIRSILLERGGEGLHIETVGRGKRDPLVPTADGVSEPKNRRVEIRLK
jgi:outer membrane protein OmpA-like peptidoglycan-associated protein